MTPLNKLIEQYTNLHDLSYAKSLYQKETKKDPDRKDTKVTEYWDECDKTADFVCWWMNKLKSEFNKLSESIAFCGKEQRLFLDEVEKGKIEGDEVFDKGGDLILFTCDWEFLDLQKVIEGK